MKKIIVSIFCSIGLTTFAQIPPQLDAELNDLTDQALIGTTTRGLSSTVYYHTGQAYRNFTRGISHDQEAIHSNMYFSFGSATKILTSTTLLKLQELNLVDLDDQLGEYLPNLSPNIPNTIPIRNLLNHTSGLDEYLDDAGLAAMNSNYEQIWTPQELLQFVEAPLAEVGAEWNYCNTNYILAGMLVEEITGQSLQDAVREYVLTPAGVENIYLVGFEPAAPEVAHFWDHAALTTTTGDITNFPLNSMASFSWAAGGFMARPIDMANFYKALFVDNSVLSEASIDELLTTVESNFSVLGIPYGLGIMNTGSEGISGDYTNIAMHQGSFFHLSAIGIDLETGNIASVAINDTEGLSTSIDYSSLMLDYLKKMRLVSQANIDETVAPDTYFYPSGYQDGTFLSKKNYHSIEVFNQQGQQEYSCDNCHEVPLVNKSKGAYIIFTEDGMFRVIR